MSFWTWHEYAPHVHRDHHCCVVPGYIDRSPTRPYRDDTVRNVDAVNRWRAARGIPLVIKRAGEVP